MLDLVQARTSILEESRTENKQKSLFLLSASFGNATRIDRLSRISCFFRRKHEITTGQIGKLDFGVTLG